MNYRIRNYRILNYKSHIDNSVILSLIAEYGWNYGRNNVAKNIFSLQFYVLPRIKIYMTRQL